MKRGFIRGLWGIHDHQGRRLYKRRSKIDNDIKVLKANPWNEPFTAYVFGEDNYKFLVDEGFNAKLVDKRPIVWDIDTEQFRHKLEVLYQGMQEFDEVVFLDWDTYPIKRLPEDFWEVLSKKQPLQAILRSYKRRKAKWRTENLKMIPCASFVYCREKKVAEDLLQLWEDMGRPWSEERVIAKYTDDLLGGWQGMEEYWNNFEPDFFYLDECKVFSKEQYASKNRCFKHLNKKQVHRRLRVGW